MPGASFARALRWAFVMNWGRQGAQAIFTLILAALLGPEIFGLVTMALVYLSFFELFLDQGLSVALIQRPERDPLVMDTAFWLVMASSVALCALSALGAEAWAGFNRTPDLAPVIWSLSPMLLFGGLALVHQAHLQREMDFRSLAVRSNASVLVGGGVGLGLALRGHLLWALVAQQLATSLTEMVLLWRLSGWRPRVRLSRQAISELFGFSTRVLMGKLGVFAHRRSDAFVLGFFFGPVALALYRMAERLMELVIELCTRPVAQVALPNFARLQHDRAALRSGVAGTLKTSSILGLPALTGLAMLSGSLVGLLGEKWRDAASVLQILCLLGAMRTLTLFTGALLQAVGRPGLMASITWALATVNIASFVIAGAWLRNFDVLDQIRGIAAVRVGTFGLLYAPVNLVLLLYFSGNSARALLRAVLPALLGSASVVVGVIALRSALSEVAIPNLAVLALETAVGAAAGLATLHAVDLDFRRQAEALFARIRGTRMRAVRQGEPGGG